MASSALHALDARLKQLSVGEWLVRRNPLYYGPTRRQLEMLRTCTPAERIAWTDSRVRTVLRAASRTPYGKQVHAPTELRDWPLLHKDAVRDSPRSFRTTGTWFVARASTGGTTGTPVDLIRSPAAVVAEQVCRDRMIRALHVDPLTARLAVLRADTIKDPSDHRPPFWSYAMGGKRLILSSSHLSDRTLPHYLEELHRFRPDVLWVHPTMLEVLCRLLKQAGSPFRVPGVFSSSEVLRKEVWQLAQSLLDCRIVDCYGQAERVAYAYATSPGEYYFLPGYAYVELLPHSQDDEGSMYEVVGTSLWNLAMPLVRYRTGDLIRVEGRLREHEIEEIAFGLRPFDSIIGRSRDVLLAPDGRSIIPGLSYIPRGIAHLLRLQIVQERSDYVVLRALTTAEFSRVDADKLLRNARLKIPASAEVRIEIAENLHRTSGGKTPFVIHSPAVQAALEAIASGESPSEARGQSD